MVHPFKKEYMALKTIINKVMLDTSFAIIVENAPLVSAKKHAVRTTALSKNHFVNVFIKNYCVGFRCISDGDSS